jgi:hypothetical protein
MEKLRRKTNRLAPIWVAATLSALLFCTYAAANIFNNRLQHFDCKNEEDAMSCRNCIATKDVELEYKVNPNNQVVQMLIYFRGNVGSSFMLDGCKVIDSSNWVCSAYSSGGGLYSSSNEKMTNGRFYSFYESNRSGKREKTYYCAK